MKAMIFDLIGVIIDETKIISKKLYSMLPEPKAINNEELIDVYSNGLKIGMLSVEAFWNRLAQKDWQVFENYFLDSLKISPTSKEVLNKFKQSYSLGVISEMPSRWASYVLKKHELIDLFNVMIFSDKFKIAKNNPILFEVIRDELKLPFKSMIYIDDKLENLELGSKYGMKTIWFKRKEAYLQFRPNGIISQLDELIEMMESLFPT